MFASESGPKRSHLIYSEGDEYDNHGRDVESTEEQDEEDKAASESVSVKETPKTDIALDHKTSIDEGGVAARKSNKKNNVKFNKKLVIKKRKLSQQNPKQKQQDQQKSDYSDNNGETEESEVSPVQRTIRKKVTYRKTSRKIKRRDEHQGQQK